MPSSVNPVVSRYLQAMLPSWLGIDVDLKRGQKPRPGLVSMREAASKLQVSYPSLREVIRDGRGVGLEFEQAVANARFGRDVTALRRSAEEWARANPLEDAPRTKAAKQTGRDPMIDEVGRQTNADRRDIDVVQSIRALQGGLGSVDEISAELDRQRRAREERERDAELRILREATERVRRVRAR